MFNTAQNAVFYIEHPEIQCQITWVISKYSLEIKSEENVLKTWGIDVTEQENVISFFFFY